MQLKQAIMERRSIRGFRKDPVSQEVLRDMLQLATRAISANNSQPWEFLVVTGAPLDALRQANLKDLQQRCQPDYLSAPLDGIYLERSKALGKRILVSMDIAREDRERRGWWMCRGFKFFDAPAAIILCMDESLDETAQRLDMGCVTQNICLAALEYGLGTCVEDQAIVYQRGIREILNPPASKKIVCAIAIGYPDWDFPANQVITEREAVDDLTTWYGF